MYCCVIARRYGQGKTMPKPDLADRRGKCNTFHIIRDAGPSTQCVCLSVIHGKFRAGALQYENCKRAGMCMS